LVRAFTLVALVGLVASSSAHAIRGRGLSLSFGSAGSEAGQLQLAANSGVAVNNTTHDVYVADTNNLRVDEFSATGTFVRAWGFGVGGGIGFEACTLACQAGKAGSGPGQFTTPTFIAVDNSGGASAGDVYVADTGDNLVQKFDAEGKLIESWAVKGQLNGEGATGGPFSAIAGVAVDTSGNLYVYDPEKLDMFEFEQDATAKPTVLVGRETLRVGIGVDSAGNLYKVVVAQNLEQFNAAGGDVGAVDPAGAGAVSDTAFAIDQSTSEIYVARTTAGIRHYVACTPAGETSCTPNDSFGQEAFSEVAGLAVDSASQDVYAADANSQRIDVFAPGSDVSTEAATNVLPSSATLNGSVNPEGAEVSDCHFDYGTDTSYGQVAPCVPAAGAGSSPVAVHADVSGLASGVTYHFRLQATSAACAGCMSFGQDVTLSTPPTPTISSPAVASLTASTAVLEAKVNPHGSDTKYHFEWGTTSGYGNSTPVGDAGEGSTEVAVSAQLSGLSANTTYHWRLLATNANGTTSTTDQTFVYDTSGVSLPDGRAYEMVTPAQKNGALIGDVFSLFGQPPAVAADGSRLIASAIQCFAGAGSCPGNRVTVGSPYAFTRAPSGWQASALAPSAAQLGSVSALNISAETDSALFAAPEPGAEREAFYMRMTDGSLNEIGPLTAPGGGTEHPNLGQVYASSDNASVVWEAPTNGQQIWPFDETNSTGRTAYEYAGGDRSQPLLVGVSGGHGSTNLISRCGTLLPGAQGTMSSDGRTLYFVAAGAARASCPSPQPPVNELFARIDNGQADAHTVALSQPQALGPAANEACKSPACIENTENSAKGTEKWRDAQMYGGSADGQKAFFGSTQQLLDSASEDPNAADTAVGSNCRSTTGANGCNLYESDLEEAAGRRLIDVSAGDTSGGGPRVRGVLAVSSDGSHVYFVASGVLSAAANARGQSAQAGAENLYVYERDATHPSGRVAFIATLAGSDAQEWNNGAAQAANVTPDGRFLVFRSHAQLTPDDSSASGAAQVFRYDAQNGELVRISIGNDGFNNDGNRAAASPCLAACSEDAWIAPGHAVEPLGAHRRDPSMSDDGAYVFFQSAVALAPGALDDAQIASEEGSGRPIYAQNVYEYHAGHVYLISDGRDVSANSGQAFTCGEGQNALSSTCLLGSDASGSNVFFSTTDRLVSSDTDTELDYYDARVCTSGDPCVQPAGEATGCQQDACQGQPSTPPSEPSAASVTFSGPGNASPPATGKGAVQGKVSVLSHIVRAKRFVLSVQVNAAGHVSVSGKGIGAVHKAVSHAGAYRLRIFLTPKARKSLRHSRSHTMRLVLHVSFTPSGGKASSATVVVKAMA
jgi:hypothetical protein